MAGDAHLRIFFELPGSIDCAKKITMIVEQLNSALSGGIIVEGAVLGENLFKELNVAFFLAKQLQSNGGSRQVG